MKRKIAILLSAMMVTSAMPMTASAAQLKADGVLNATFAKANEPIDANAKDYTTYNEVEKLKGRRSVVKVALKDDGTNYINEEISFKVNLENGTFDENNKARYEYVNANAAGVRVDYNKAMGLDGTGTRATDLTTVYNNIADATASTKAAATVEIDKPLDVNSLSGEVLEPLKAAIETINAQDKSTNQSSTFTDIDAFFKSTVGQPVKNAFDKVVEAVVAEQAAAAGVVDLAHIPYEIKIDSPTTATITVPNLQLKDSDKTIKLAGNKVDGTKITLTLMSNDSTPITDLKELGSDGTTISHIKIDTKTNGAITAVEGKEIKDPYIALPLGAVIADGNAPVKAKITSAYNDKVVGGEYTITTSVQEGDTNLVYDKNNVKSFEDYGKLAPVVIQENVRGTIGNNKDTAEVTLRLNGGFRFKTTSGDKGTNETTLKVYDDKTGNILKISKVDSQDSYFSANDSVIRFKVSGLTANRTSPIGLRIDGLFVEANNDKTFGDVELSVSGTGITSSTKVVARREKLGFKLETLKDAKEIISGRHYVNNNVSMSESDNTTVEVKFSESVPNTLVESRALDFSVPEGVKIVGAEVSKQNNFTEAPQAEDFEIINNGKTLRLKRDSYTIKDDKANTNILANFVLKLDLSVDPGFSGDIKLGVTGGGQSEVVETVIAKAVIPFEIKSQTTNANLGYQDYNTADIVITETRPGMFLENKTAVLSLSAPYGTQELGFSEAKFEISGGELEVKEKDFKVGDYKSDNETTKGTINFKINKASYKNPSTITIKNVKIGTTRSVPFGSYDLKLSGDAVINNYKSNINDDKSFAITAKDTNLVNQNNTSSYDFKEYVKVVTETGTFDQTVKVTVGEKTVLVGDKAIDMDVAPYIQASSNSTMVPLRFVSVALGVDTANVTNPDASNKIAWDANTKTTTIYYGAGTGQKIIQFQAGSNIMTVDGTRIPMEYGVTAEIKDGRMFVPFRALGQALGVAVTWDADTRTAIYNENNARNTNTTTTASTTTASTTASSSTTTESTTASTDSTTETTTAKK